MSERFLSIGLMCILLVASYFSNAQIKLKLDTAIAVPDKVFALLDRKVSSIDQKLGRQTNRYLDRLERQESKLKKKLSKKDTALARQLFDGVDQRYVDLKNTATGKLSKYSSLYANNPVYSGHLDSLSTALKFLNTQNLKDNPELQKTLKQYSELQSKLNATEQLQKYLTDRQNFLKQQFQQLGMVKELKKFRKEVYYYRAQVKEYKQQFEDPNKVEAKLMEFAMKLPQFKDFFAKNSALGSMFALPGGNGTTSLVSLAGLQTRAMISQTLVDRFGTGSNVTQMLQQNVQSAQGQLNALKSKASSYANGSYGNTGGDDIPGFKPNNEKTKSLWKRLEYGGNIQSQRARYFFPVTSDLALSLGYKLNDKSSIGLGASYKLGFGNNWSSIKLSHQGIGLRSYLDWKIKGSFYFSGAYEQNYRSLINSISQLQNYSAWQTSGLIGVSKKYSISKKMKGEMKLLWDFMSYQAMPRQQPILFRVGYSLK